MLRLPRFDAMGLWLLLGMAGCTLLPWYTQQDSAWYLVLTQTWSSGDAGNALVQATRQGRVWLWAGPVALAACAAAWGMRPSRAQGLVLLLGGGLGVLALTAAGFAIGARGWTSASLNATWGELALNQFGMGAGAALTLTALLMLFSFGLARRGNFRGDLFVAASVVGAGALLGLFIVYPVLKSIQGAWISEDGAWSLAALWARVGTERVWGLGCMGGEVRCGVAWNTLFLGLITATGTTVMGAVLAVLTERGRRHWQAPLKLLAMLPIITPPFVVGLGLILLFGRAGVVNQLLEWAFGIEPSRWFYGVLGIWVAQMFAFTPIAFMIMRGVVQGVSPSLEEAAQTLRASPERVWSSITLPLLKPGLANAFLVGFIESMADFGNPIIVGAQYSVLSTDIFFAIVGAQNDQGMAAALALLLTAFALLVFGLQHRLLGRQNFTTVSGKGDAGLPLALPARLRTHATALALPWLTFTLVVYGFAFVGGFVQNWGRDYTPTLAHFHAAFALEWGPFGLVWAGSAWNSLITTLQLAAIAAVPTAALGLLIAWLLARTQFRAQAMFEFAALVAFAIPGTVLGVSYILAFNVPPFELTGTAFIIVLCFIFRDLPVGVRAGMAAFKQIDRALDEASTMLRASAAQTLLRVVLPLLKPAVVAALVYSFVRAMTTISAVIFLVTAENELATTYIIGRVGNGDYGVALAYCTVLMVLMSLAVALIQWLVGERKLGRRKVSNA